MPTIKIDREYFHVRGNVNVDLETLPLGIAFSRSVRGYKIDRINAEKDINPKKAISITPNAAGENQGGLFFGAIRTQDTLVGGIRARRVTIFSKKNNEIKVHVYPQDGTPRKKIIFRP